MIFKASELYDKEIICSSDGTRLGIMSDFDINCSTGYVETIIIYGRAKLFGLLGREEDIVIPWSCIEVMGDDIILVNCSPPRHKSHRNRNFLSKFTDF
ncbi:MAG: YlmC/YmxH family sporulation protein [Clostridia bacterium]|nr:YlmC/YmxH family sporulation protein [Clostridia bacterium]